MKDSRGGYNNWICLGEWEGMSYEQLLERLSALRKERAYVQAA